MGVDSKRAKAVKADIRKRTPLEQAIAEETSRKARYEAGLRRKGIKRSTFQVREELFPLVRSIIDLANGDDGQQALFRELADRARAVQ